MNLSRWIGTALVSLSAVSLAACDAFITGCTLIGCANTLTVEVANAPAGDVVVQARTAGSSDSVQTVTCPDGPGCFAPNRAQFVNFLPSRVELTITTSAGVKTATLQPEYANSYPNGRSCGPECTQGTVRFTW